MKHERAERRLTLPDSDATEALGHALAVELRRGDFLALMGDLGAGKTTMARGLLRALGEEGPVPSPTFTLVQHYESAALSVAHFDLYRLASVEESFELGLDEACHAGAALVEWPEILGGTMPVDRLEIHLLEADNGREAQLVGLGAWADRLAALDLS